MTAPEASPLQFAARSHPGMSGKNNEDRYAVSVYQLAGDPPVPALFAIVCDGVGGRRAGEVAAEIAVETITRTVIAGNPSQPLQTLSNSIIHAGQRIYQQSEADMESRGMGATCACAWIIGDRLYVAYVGDSRIYLIRRGQVRQISIDHTWIQEALDNGLLTPDQARGHPNAHVIRRYLGSRQPVVPDLRLHLHPQEDDRQAEANQGLTLELNDQLLLCSDGLTDLVNEAEILQHLDGQDQESALEALVALANERGGHDNITVVALHVAAPFSAGAEIEETQSVRIPTPMTADLTAPTQSIAPPPAPARPRRLTCAGLGLMLFLSLLLLAGAYWALSRPQPTPPPSLAETQPPLITQPVLLPSRQPSPSPTTRRLPSPSPSARTTRSAATLTPWPTNTLAP